MLLSSSLDHWPSKEHHQIITISCWIRFCKLVTRCNRWRTISRERYVVLYARMQDGSHDLNSSQKLLYNNTNTTQPQSKNTNNLWSSHKRLCSLKKQILGLTGRHKNHNLMHSSSLDRGQQIHHKGSFLCIRSKSWSSRALGKPLSRTRTDFRRNRQAGAVTIWEPWIKTKLLSL